MKSSAPVGNSLQLGAYTLDQVAALVGIRPDMAHRWLYGSVACSAALIPQRDEDEGLATFVDLVQVMAVRTIRQSRRLSLQKIRKTIEVAHEHGVAFPFARKHTTYVFHDDVVIRLNDNRLMQVTGKYHDQDLMEPVVETYLKDLSFDKLGLADNYKPLRRGYRQVILSPTMLFGAPTVIPCGYTVATLVDAFYAEGGVSAAARVCGVNDEDIRIAVDYEDSLRNAA